VREPATLRTGDAPAAWLLLDEGQSQADVDRVLADAAAGGYRVASEERLLEDADHEARERWHPWGKRAAPVELVRLEKKN
jgi:hypothetical protein